MLLSWSHPIHALCPTAALSHSELLPNTTIGDCTQNVEKLIQHDRSFFTCPPCLSHCKPPSPPCWHIQSNYNCMQGKGIAVMGPCVPPHRKRDWRQEFIDTPWPPLRLIIPSRNQREEERAASVTQRRYNNRKKTNQLIIPKPSLPGSRGRPRNKWQDWCASASVCGQPTNATHG